MQFAKNLVNKGNGVARKGTRMMNMTEEPDEEDDYSEASALSSGDALNENIDQKDKNTFMALGRNLHAKVFEYLLFKDRMRIRRLSKPINLVLLEKSFLLLQNVDLSPFHKQVNDKVVIDSGCFCGQRLRSLNLRNCWQISNDGLARLSHHAQRLRVLCLSSLWEITDDGIVIVAQTCKLLQQIELNNCRKITDRAILSILDHCKYLEVIGVGYCKNLSDNVMNSPSWANMKRVSFQRCTGIFDAGFQHWSEIQESMEKSTIRNSKLIDYAFFFV